MVREDGRHDIIKGTHGFVATGAPSSTHPASLQTLSVGRQSYPYVSPVDNLYKLKQAKLERECTLKSSSNLRATRFSFFPTDEKFRSRRSENSGSAAADRWYFFFFSFVSVDVGGGLVEEDALVSGSPGTFTGAKRDAGISTCA